jgi:hypothetical protein
MQTPVRAILGRNAGSQMHGRIATNSVHNNDPDPVGDDLDRAV